MGPNLVINNKEYQQHLTSNIINNNQSKYTSIITSSLNNCDCIHEVDIQNYELQKHFYQSHLDIKTKLIENLELIIDEQEGRIHELRQTLKAQTGRISPLTISEQKMMKGISHLSLDFGELSEENLQLKEDLLAAEVENKRLHLRLKSTVTNYSELALLMDNETQTEVDDDSFMNSKYKRSKKSIEEDSVIQDTEEEYIDDSASETASSLNQSDTVTNISKTQQLMEENQLLKNEIAKLKSSEDLIKEMKLTAETTFNKLLQRYEEEVSLRKALHDALVQLRGNIRVFCRIRPNKESIRVIEHDMYDSDAVNVTSDTGIKRFLFDRVFDEKSDQIDLYQEVEPLVLSCLDGMNVCIFAYGQTGSGKTYTMDGPEDNPGIGSRALIQIFETLNCKKQSIDFTIDVSVIEIYNEKIRDLLDQSNQKLELKLDKNGQQKINNLSKHVVDSIAKVQNILDIGRKNRSVASTALNDQSSRSHAIIMVTITMIDKNSGAKSIGKLNLIDLAGSERVAKSQVSGPQLKEAQFINKSLSELGNVVAALRRKQQHIPFRNCQLTRILEDSLDGDSKTLMIVQIASEKSFIQESISSLNFAEKISNVTRRTPKSQLRK